MVEIAFEEEAEFMVLLTKCDYDAAMTYLVAQDEYFDILGLNVYEEDVSEHRADGLVSDIVVKEEEMNQFISERTGISIEMCEQFSEAELKFLEKKGLVSEGGKENGRE